MLKFSDFLLLSHGDSLFAFSAYLCLLQLHRYPNSIERYRLLILINNLAIDYFIKNARKPRAFKLGDEWHPERSHQEVA